MEQLNKVEIRGTVGNVRTQTIGNRKVCKITVATNLAFVDNTGCPVIETTWHSVTVWENESASNLDDLQKGSKVHIIGRLRTQRYTAADGTDRSFTEILAKTVTKLDDTEQLRCQM